MIPIRTDYRLHRTPWANYALLAANVILFVLGYHGGNPHVRHWLLYPDNPQLYQFFTSMFMHAGWMHLIGNMVFLWVFGNAINDKFGHLGYLAFYLAGGVLAGLAYILIGGNAPVLGASGAISAVTGAFLVLLPRSRVTVMFWFYIITFFDISSLYFLMFQFVWNLIMSFSVLGGTGAGGGVAYTAHSSGYLFGIVISAALLAGKLLPRDPFDLLNLIRDSRRRATFRRMVGRGYDPFSRTAGAKAQSGRKWVSTNAVTAEQSDTPAARELLLRREISQACDRHDLHAAAVRYLELVQIADEAVLPKPQQLDVANQLMAHKQHPAAADAYERFLKHYGNYEHLADIYLMLGILYGRYLHKYDRAEQMLSQAVEKLTDERKIELAKADLEIVRARRGE